MAEKVQKSKEEWKKELTPEQFQVCRMKGTEPAFTGVYYDSKDKGTYRCSCCGNELFSSDTKYNSGTGWPSFWAPFSEHSVRMEPDESGGRSRVEVLCQACDAHLGHVFEDGPAPTNQRYCINSVSLDLEAEEPESVKA